jgi:hypothetical protein
MTSECQGSQRNLDSTNRPVRTRVPGGVAGDPRDTSGPCEWGDLIGSLALRVRKAAQRVLLDEVSLRRSSDTNRLGARPVQRLKALEKHEGSEKPVASAASVTLARASSCAMASSLRTASRLARKVLPCSRKRRCSVRDVTPRSWASALRVTLIPEFGKTRIRNLFLISAMCAGVRCCAYSRFELQLELPRTCCCNGLSRRPVSPLAMPMKTKTSVSGRVTTFPMGFSHALRSRDHDVTGATGFDRGGPADVPDADENVRGCRCAFVCASRIDV